MRGCRCATLFQVGQSTSPAVSLTRVADWMCSMLRRGGRRRGLSDFALGGALGCLCRYWPRESGCGHGGGPAEETARHSGPRAYRRAEAPLVFVARGWLKWVRPRLRCNQRTACASKTLWHAAASGVLTIVAAPLPRIQLATGVPVTDEAAFFVVDQEVGVEQTSQV